MFKRIIALLLCVATCLTLCLTMASCNRPDIDNDNKGQSLIMYLADNLYDLDPVNAYNNESTANVVSLLFETLFKINEKGKIEGSLAKKYTVHEDDTLNEYKMEIELNATNWSDGQPVSADDFRYACSRLLDPEASYEAASLIFDIKNARAVKSGDCSPDDLGVTADGSIITIYFEGKIDYDRFVLNLTSLALAPIREDIANKSDDWAKKPSTMVTSGPFKLSRISFSSENTEIKYGDINWTTKKGTAGDYIKDCSEAKITSFILERNAYYYRDKTKDEKLDKAVTPYRIIVDCSLFDNDILEGYRNGSILCINDIPLSIRENLKDEAIVKDSLSTHTYYFNQNAKVLNKTTNEEVAIFAIPEVRQALSMAIDRDAIAETVVFAKAAEGIVSHGVLAYDSIKETYRAKVNSNYEYLKQNIDAAVAKLEEAEINPADYAFSITVAAYDDVHLAIAEIVAEAWTENLGFEVTLNKRGTVINNDYYALIEDIPTDMCDDLYVENLEDGNFEVIALDLSATTTDAFTVLAPFAKAFAGQSMDMSVRDNYVTTPHITGYDSDEYNAKIEEIFAEKDMEKRSDMYAAAEAILMKDMPAMPIVHNQLATVISESLELNNKFLFWEKSASYYSTLPLAKAYVDVKEYDAYKAACLEWVEYNYYFYADQYLEEAWVDVYGETEEEIEAVRKLIPFTYLGKYKDLYFYSDNPKDAFFQKETSIYDFLFPKIDITVEVETETDTEAVTE